MSPSSAVELRGVTKRFPGVIANNDISLVFEPGQVHALLGENGAGKSTLISMLAGMQQPDEGTLFVDGKPVKLSSPRHALNMGIGTVYQHTLLVKSLTVLENLMLGSKWWQRYDKAATLARFRELSDILNARIDPEAMVGRLALGEQQQVEIMRALWHGEKVLILDEPTSMLTPQGAQELFQIVRRIRDHGVAVIFITHKLREAHALADQVSVLRLGKVVGHLTHEEMQNLSQEDVVDQIVGMMFGAPPTEEDRQVAGSEQHAIATRNTAGHADEQVALRNAVTLGERGECPLRGATLSIGKGEVLGIAGVDGNGQKHLAEALAGQRALSDGQLLIDGANVTRGDVVSRRIAGVRYITDERLGEGTAGTHSVATNLLLKEIGTQPFWTRFGVAKWGLIHGSARTAITDHDIRTPSEKAPIASLSGGNIQKALLARELSPDAKLIVFNKPTYGLDLQNTKLARARIREGAGSETASILVISNELDELIETCDRIAVMSNGKITGVVENKPGAEEEIGRLMIDEAAAA